MTDPPTDRHGSGSFEAWPFPHWSFVSRGIQVRFVGKAPSHTVSEALRAFDGAPDRVGWLKQRHSAATRAAAPGLCGQGDALWTTEPALALCIVTADCVPIVCGSGGRLVAIHAGWRGLVAGVIEAAMRALPESEDGFEAWLGPAIGSCCYEVGDDVAKQVIDVSSDEIARAGGSGKRHLNLQSAAQIQLLRLGAERVHRVAQCTKCHPDLLWSYRGSRGQRGRNLALAWLSS